MPKFNVVVTRTDEYEIDIDEKEWNAGALKSWSGTFSKVTTINDFIRKYAVSYMKAENTSFIEGYGYVKELNRSGSARLVPFYIDGKLSLLPEENFTKGITIKPLMKNDDYDVYLTKMDK